MPPVARCPWITLAEIDQQYRHFGVYFKAMRDECTRFLGRSPSIVQVEDDDLCIMLSFEWEKAR